VVGCFLVYQMRFLTSQQNAWLACVVSIVALSSTSLSQTKQNRDLTRNDIVIQRDRPTIYICVDANVTKKNGSDDLWLKLNNNTIWTVRFESDRAGTKPQLHRLANGKSVAALSKDSIAFPRYEIESKDNRQSVSLWGDVGTFNW